MKKNDMGGACGMCGGEVHTGFCWRDLRERDVLKHIGINGKIILKGSSRNRMRG